VVQPLDEGGQARVYRAVHPALGKDVVIKWGRRPEPGGPEARERLLREGRILAALEHPHLARVHDLGWEQGRPFLVMEHVRGRNLEQCARQQRPTPAQAAALLARVARGLAAAHQVGVVHRDVKPQNILVDESGRPRLIDFGLALVEDVWHQDAEAPGTVSGTMQFMAPEQARGETERVGPRSDLFALGGVLYFLLTGKAPFAGESLTEVLWRARACDFDRAALGAAGVPRRLAAICLRAMAADPAQRYASAAEMAAELEAFPRRRRPLAWVGAGLLLLGLLALPWVLGWWDAPPPPGGDGGRRADRGAPGAADRLALSVRVWEEDRYRDLVAVAPLRTGSELEVRVEVPAGTHAALFLFTSEGRLRLLAAQPAGASASSLRYPAEGKAARLAGPPGTELVLVCGRREGPVGLEEVRGVWGAAGAWPALPPQSVLGLQADRVVVERTHRDLVLGPGRPDPEGEVRKRLEELRRQMRQRFPLFEGLAFAHRK
jgi:eukaryotic-like serine/threonine-protein kinase